VKTLKYWHRYWWLVDIDDIGVSVRLITSMQYALTSILSVILTHDSAKAFDSVFWQNRWSLNWNYTSLFPIWWEVPLSCRLFTLSIRKLLKQVKRNTIIQFFVEIFMAYLLEKNRRDILKIINATALWTPCSKENVTFSSNTFFILQTVFDARGRYIKRCSAFRAFSLHIID